MMAENKEAPPVSKGASNQMPAMEGTTGAAACPIIPAGSVACAPLQVCRPSQIPLALREARRWAPWAGIWDAQRGKYDKVPRQAAKPWIGLSTKEVHSWVSFDEAKKAFARHPDMVAGLGYCMTGPHGVVGIDLDHCMQADGTPEPWAAEIVDQMASYTEVSPSGNGLRIFVLGAIDADWTNPDQGLEVYGGHEPRFLTVTGQRLAGAPADVRPADPAALQALAARYAKERRRVDIQDLGIPDLIDDPVGLVLPDVATLPLPEKVERFLLAGEADGDRSGVLHAAGVALYSAGLDDAMVLSLLAGNEHAMAVALDHRRQDYDRALLYLWREHCVKARAKASTPASPDEFNDVSPTEQDRIEQAGKDRAALDALRREHQKRENEQIGEGSYRIPIAEKITLESALDRFVFLSEGSLVADVLNPHFVLKLADWKNTYAASTKDISGAPGKPPKAVPVAQLWHASERRKTVTTRTFKAGGGLMIRDPDGKLAVNSWRPFDRSLRVDDLRAAGVGLFVDHVEFLFGADAPRFLDWLAHIEQRPEVLPHTSWLHIAKHFGMGRNWLASVLARVWAGAAAVNLDLVGLLNSGFNDRLSRKVLAVVDEIREGGGDSPWKHSEKLKSIITEEVRRINPKYGHTSLEFNACRWLLFSNHLSAIPLEKGDRRVEVVSTDVAPRGAAYYVKLYQALESPRFIAAVAAYLGQRDISGFNPGAHALNTEAKQAATKASQTPMAEACQLLIEYWPADFITAADLFAVLTMGQAVGGTLTAAHRRTLEQAGIQSWGKPVKVDGKATRVSILRNHAAWRGHGTPDTVRAELEKAKFDAFDADAYTVLLDRMAGG